jgi:hypothetical protein
MREPFLPAEFGNEARILAILPFAPHHLYVEIGFHLKELRKVFFVGLKEVI